MERPKGLQRFNDSVTPSAALFTWSEQSSLFFFSFDVTAHQLDYLNPAFQEFLGLSGDVVNFSTLLTMVHPDDQQHLKSKFSDCLNGKAVAEVECRVVRKNEVRWLRINPFRYEENNKTWLMGNGEDVSVYKEHSENLNIHNNKKNSILNILAHDLAGPIGTVGNLSELLRRETADVNNPKVMEYIGMVSKISKSCINLIRDFLNQEFLESQGIRLLKKRVELVEKMTTVTQEYLGMQKELKLQFVCHANREVVYAEIDEDKFLQVISNLISNSMKFTPDNGTITVNIEESDHSVLISVADNGIGIPQKYQATLFEKFSDARRNGLRGEHSTGLGMSIIKTIVEWHQGKVWFESEENKGTTFYIELPRE